MHVGGKQTSAHDASAENSFPLGGLSPFVIMGKQLVTEAVALREVGTRADRSHYIEVVAFLNLFFKMSRLLFPPPCTHTHTYTQLPSFLLHLISGPHSLDVFLLCCSNDFGRYWLN